MNAQEIIKVAVEACGLEEVPADSGVIVDGDNIHKVLFGVDMEAAEILIARELGYDGVITHHPKGGNPMVNLSNFIYMAYIHRCNFIFTLFKYFVHFAASPATLLQLLTHGYIKALG
jgi:putative NIF3 family GTP cyclohydrolase 1 type 2